MRTPATQLSSGYALIPELMLWIALIVGLVCMGLFVFSGYETAGSYILVPVMLVSAAAVLFGLLPAIVLALIRKTRAIGGALLYVISAVWLIYVWLYVLFLIYQYKGRWWAVAGVVLSVFSSGYGIFGLFTVMAIASGQWLPLLYILAPVFLCRVACNIGRGLMGLRRPNQSELVENGLANAPPSSYQ